MPIPQFVRLSIILCALCPMIGQATPAVYNFSSGSVPSSANSDLQMFFSSATVSGTFTYDNAAPFSRFGGLSDPPVKIYNGAMANLIGSLGGATFSDPFGRAIVGDEKFDPPGGPPKVDIFRLESLFNASNLVGFEITVGEIDYTLVNVNIDWFEGEQGLGDFLTSDDLLPVPPTQGAALLFEFESATTTELLSFQAATVTLADADGDGIVDAIDGTFTGAFNDQSAGFSNDFTDQHLPGDSPPPFGTTFGTIVDRGDLFLQVTDHSNLTEGVVLSASGGTEFAFEDSSGRVIVGDEASNVPDGLPDDFRDVVRIRTQRGRGTSSNLVGFPITVGGIDYILVGLSISWFEGQGGLGDFLTSDALPAELPTTLDALLEFEFALTTDPDLLRTEFVFFPGVIVTRTGEFPEFPTLTREVYSFSSDPAFSSNNPELLAVFSSLTVSGTFTYDNAVAKSRDGVGDPPVSIYHGAWKDMTGSAHSTAQIQMCSDPATDVFLTKGDQVAATCGSLKATPLAGQAVVAIGNITITIPAGAAALISEKSDSTISIISSESDEEVSPLITIVALVDGKAFTKNLIPDDEVKSLASRETVTIDISPWSTRNLVIPWYGYMVVVVLSTDLADEPSVKFDANEIDHSTIAFGPDGAASRFSFLLDVDRDGDDDAVFIFKTRDTGIECGNTEVTLTGLTDAAAAIAITGTDSIQTIFCT